MPTAPITIAQEPPDLRLLSKTEEGFLERALLPDRAGPCCAELEDIGVPLEHDVVEPFRA